jgi:hypothetical protein
MTLRILQIQAPELLSLRDCNWTRTRLTGLDADSLTP